MHNVKPHGTVIRRQAVIALIFSCLSVGLLVHVLFLGNTAWSRFGWSSELAICILLAVVFTVLAAFNLCVAFLFEVRGVNVINRQEDGVLLILSNRAYASPIRASDFRVVRRFGEQGSGNDNSSRFTLIKAANRYWVIPTPIEISLHEGQSGA